MVTNWKLEQERAAQHLKLQMAEGSDISSAILHAFEVGRFGLFPLSGAVQEVAGIERREAARLIAKATVNSVRKSY